MITLVIYLARFDPINLFENKFYGQALGQLVLVN